MTVLGADGVHDLSPDLPPSLPPSLPPLLPPSLPPSLPTAGELIVHQLILFVPVERFPEPKLPKCRRKKRTGGSVAGEEVEDDSEDEDIDAGVAEDTSRARVLWIRNLTRIQRQVG